MKRPMLADMVIRKPDGGHHILKWVRDNVLVSPKFVIDNVGEWAASLWQRGVPTDATQILCAMPPFKMMWMECMLPQNAVKQGMNPLRGWLFQTVKIDDMYHVWVYQVVASRGDYSLRILVPVFRLRRDGSFFVPPDGTLKIDVDTLQGYEHYCVNDEDRRNAVRWCVIPLFAIGFMHCHGVTHKLLPDMPAKWVQQARRRDGHPTLRYNVIDIEPMQRVVKAVSRQHGVSQERALHLCRGHFKDYRKSGLFGKIKGIFWWDEHARGDAENGVVVSDYNVKI